ncbi:MAG: Abi family protein [Puniceicoccales bacterium]|jgi:abortive infection bacteriophage resistance protein|nr:Abi family protein [Puniceicoccales bacterium]
MRYDKIPLSLEKQADQLLARGLVADRAKLIARLKAVNYYRLSGYWFPYRAYDSSGKRTDQFATGTTLDKVWRHLTFDRRLRCIFLDAIERIEVAVRSRLVFHFVHAHGAFGHLDNKNLPRFKPDEHANWLNALKRAKERASKAKTPFVTHFDATYGDVHNELPLWMACELMTCGDALRFANAVEPFVIAAVATDYGFPIKRLDSWMKAVFTARNSCAHHARIWNQIVGVKPLVPPLSEDPQWHITTGNVKGTAPAFSPDRTGLLLTVCHFWLGKISSTTKWKERLFRLFDGFPEIEQGELRNIGLPENWRQHPLWQ